MRKNETPWIRGPSRFLASTPISTPKIGECHYLRIGIREAPQLWEEGNAAARRAANEGRECRTLTISPFPSLQSPLISSSAHGLWSTCFGRRNRERCQLQVECGVSPDAYVSDRDIDSEAFGDRWYGWRVELLGIAAQSRCQLSRVVGDDLFV